MKRQFPRPSSKKGLMLIEVMIAVVLVAATGLGVLSGITYGIFSQQRVHEKNGASRVCVDWIEQIKRVQFNQLSTLENETVTIYDNGTPGNTADDVTGRFDLRFHNVTFDEDGNMEKTLFDAGTPLPQQQLPLVLAELTVTWTSAGKKGSKTETVKMETLLAP